MDALQHVHRVVLVDAADVQAVLGHVSVDAIVMHVREDVPVHVLTLAEMDVQEHANLEQWGALSSKMAVTNQKITVEIDNHESETVERLFYLHNAGQDNIAYLMKDKDIRYDILQEYIDVTECRYVELEMLKEELANKYMPKDGKDYQYVFDFKNSAMIFTEM